MARLFVGVVVGMLALLSTVHAFPSGAPDCVEPCGAMGPDGAPSTEPLPFEITILDSTGTPVDFMRPNSDYEIVLHTLGGEMLNGFYLDALALYSGIDESWGEFSSSTAPFRFVSGGSCGGRSGISTITQNTALGGVSEVIAYYHSPPEDVFAVEAGVQQGLHLRVVAVAFNPDPAQSGKYWLFSKDAPMSCVSDAECVPMDCHSNTVCGAPDANGVRTCESTPDPSMQGTRCGENGDLVCDGSGTCSPCASHGDCFTGNMCLSSSCDVSGVCVDSVALPENESCNDGNVCTATGECVPCMNEWTPWSLCTATCGGGMSSRYRSKSVDSPAGCDTYNGFNNLEEQTCNTATCTGSDCYRSSLHFFDNDPGTTSDDQVLLSRCPDEDATTCAENAMVLYGLPYWELNAPGDGMIPNTELDTCGTPA